MNRIMKGVLPALALALLLFCVFASAADRQEQKTLHYNGLSIVLGGKRVEPKDANGKTVEPFIIDGTTYLPLRAVAGALGLAVDWNADTNTAILRSTGAEAADGSAATAEPAGATVPRTEQKTLHYNGLSITLDGKRVEPKDANGKTVEPFIIDGTTYLPLRAVAGALGLTVDWNADTNTAILTGGQPVKTTFTNPVAPGADPFVLKDIDGTYYLYATSAEEFGYRVYSSKNLVEWTAHGLCLSKDDVYTKPTNSTNLQFWAPEVIRYDGKYYMVYTAQHRIGIAIADSPLGPFKTGSDGYLINVCNVIDGSFFYEDGVMYLYFVTQGAASLGGYNVQNGNNIWGCVLDMNTLTIKNGSVKLLVSPDPKIELEYANGGDCCEGPFMIKNGGTYYLTFSSNRYYSTKYSVQYATSDAPLGDFVRDAGNITLMCDDLDYQDNQNPHLYGTGHHCFVEAPNGKDTLIVYHAHRTGVSDNFVGTGTATVSDFNNPLCTPRSACVDLAWFEDGKLLAGSKAAPTVPTAVEQPLFEGTALTRKTHYTGVFAGVSEKPTLYVSQKDGKDTSAGTKTSPMQSLDRAIGKLTDGGTVILISSYDAGTVFTLPVCNGPVVITAEHNNVILSFKYLRIGCDVYFDNIIFSPVTVHDIAVIEGCFHNIVMGEGVSCLSRRLEGDFPYLVGGRWKYEGASKESLYTSYFRPEGERMLSDKAYSVHLYGGTWQSAVACSALMFTPLPNTTPSAVLTVENTAAVKTR